MALQLPPLSWLRAFEAAARHLSFTDAGAELSLTQAAISKQIKLLEHYLREPVFERRARSLALTKAGEAYLPKVQDAFDRLGAGTDEVFGHRRTERLTLRAPVSFAVNWMAPRLPGFLAAHPAVPLRIISSVWTEDAEPPRFDLDIRYGMGKWPGYRVDRLSWELLEPMCAPDVAARLTTPDDLARERLIHVLGYKEGWADWLKAAGAGRANAGAGLQCDTSLMALELAAQGGGIALGRRSMTAPYLGAGRLVRPFAISVPAEEGFYLLVPEAGQAHPQAAVLRAWLVAEAEQAAR